MNDARDDYRPSTLKGVAGGALSEIADKLEKALARSQQAGASLHVMADRHVGPVPTAGVEGRDLEREPSSTIERLHLLADRLHSAANMIESGIDRIGAM